MWSFDAAMWSNSSISMREVIITSIVHVFDQKSHFIERRSWFKFSFLGLALGTNLKFYTSVAKGLRLKIEKFWRLIATFVEVTGEKLVGKPFWSAHPE